VNPPPPFHFAAKYFVFINYFIMGETRNKIIIRGEVCSDSDRERAVRSCCWLEAGLFVGVRSGSGEVPALTSHWRSECRE
jgi:hypothetical protein